VFLNCYFAAGQNGCLTYSDITLGHNVKCDFFLFSHFDILEIGLPNWHSHRTTNNGETGKVSPGCINYIKCPKWTYRIKNEELLHRKKEEMNILRTVKRRKSNWIGHIFRINCPLKHVIEERIQGAERQRRRHKQLMDSCKEKGRCWNLKARALDCAQ
jgi:hypothetical protein